MRLLLIPAALLIATVLAGAIAKGAGTKTVTCAAADAGVTSLSFTARGVSSGELVMWNEGTLDDGGVDNDVAIRVFSPDAGPSTGVPVCFGDPPCVGVLKYPGPAPHLRCQSSDANPRKLHLFGVVYQ